MMRAIVNLIGMALTWGAWFWVIDRKWSPAVNLVGAFLGTLLIVPLVFLGRWLLDHQPTIRRAEWVTTLVHYLLAMFLGSALIAATRFGLTASGWVVPLPPWIGLAFMFLGGLLMTLVVFNLALKGLGAPFAVALTRVVATEWLYAWTRNPMILSALAFLIGMGLWLQSGLFLIWLLMVLSPAILVFLKVYEERELEIRFGPDYLRYRSRTPMLLPRKPAKPD